MRDLESLGISPAPWRVHEWAHDDNEGLDVVCSETDAKPRRDVVCDCGLYFDDALCRANARLIAAAPELYEACARLLNFMPLVALKDGDIGKAIEFAKSALAAASGESEVAK